MGRRRADEKIFVCQRDQERDTIIRRSINTTLPKDAILNSKFKPVP